MTFRTIAAGACLIAVACFCAFNRSSAEEGFFKPAQVKTPFNQTRVLSSLARVTENLYFDTIVLEDKHDVDTLRTSFKLYRGTGRKTYLPEGVVLWHLVLTKQQLLQWMEDPSSHYEDGVGVIVDAFKKVDTFPAERIVPTQGWANATFISSNGLLLTNYHVVREQVEALGRQAGCSREVPAPFMRVQLPIISRGEIVGWRRAKQVDLVANLSQSDWQHGLDGAMLRVRDGIGHAFLQVRTTPAKIGESIWLYGDPYATNRPSAALRAHGYTNADQDLRVSIGRVTALKPPDFIADADGINGDSGGAVVDSTGKLLGYDWDVYGQSAAQRIMSFAGGDIIVRAHLTLSRLQHLSRCPQ